MPKPSFIQSFLGRPSRSYAEPSSSHGSGGRNAHDARHFHTQSYSLKDLNQAGPSRRAHSTISYAGPSSRSRRNEARSPSPTSASEVGPSRRRLVSNNSLFDGECPPLPPPPHVHFNTPQNEWDVEETGPRMSSAPGPVEGRIDRMAETARRPVAQSRRPDDTSAGQAPRRHEGSRRPAIPQTYLSDASTPSPQRHPTLLPQHAKQLSHKVGFDDDHSKQEALSAWSSARSPNSSLDSTPERDPLTPLPSLVSTHPQPPVVPNGRLDSVPSTPDIDTGTPDIADASLTPAAMMKPSTKPTSAEDDAASEYDVFYTPRSSMFVQDSEEEDDAETPSVTVLPTFNFQPPTPASVGDMVESPFHEHSRYLSPDHSVRRTHWEEEDEESDEETPSGEPENDAWEEALGGPGSPVSQTRSNQPSSRRRVTLVEPESESESEPEFESGQEDEASESEPEKEQPAKLPAPVAQRPPQRPPLSPSPKLPTPTPKAGSEKPGLKPPKVFPIDEDNLPPPPVRTKVKKPSAGGKVRGASMTIVAASSSPTLRPTKPERPLSRSGSYKAYSNGAEPSRSRSNSLRSIVLSPPLDARPSSRAGGSRTAAASPQIERTQSPSPSPKPLPPSASMPLDRPRSRASTTRTSSGPPEQAPVTPKPKLTRSKSARSVQSTHSSKSTKTIRNDKALPPVPPKPSSDRPMSAYEQERRFSGGSHATGSDMSGSSFRSDGLRGAGYGKGGWAAASAEPTVMYMPATGGDGWAAFQPLPPRSRATPLPGGSRSSRSSIDLDRSRSPTNSATSSILGLGASASLDGRVSYQNSPGGAWNRHSPASSTNGRVNPTPPRALSPLAHNSQPSASYPSPPASVVEAEQGSPGVRAHQPPSDDEVSDMEERPSRSYSAVTKAPSDVSYDYGSEHATSRATSQDSSPAKRYDGSGREQRWAPPDYDPYADAPPGKVNISPAAPGMLWSRGSMPVIPRSASVSSNISEYSDTTPRVPTTSQMTHSSFPGLSIPPHAAPVLVAGRPESFNGGMAVSSNGSGSMRSFGRPMSPPTSQSPYEAAARAHAERLGFHPSTLNPDFLTVLPEMSESDSNQLYLPESRHKHRFSSSVSEAGGIRRSSSLWGKHKYARSDVGHDAPRSDNGRHSMSEASEGRSNGRQRISLDEPPRPKSRAGSSVGGDMGLVSESHGYDQSNGGYTNLYVPQGGGYKPGNPKKTASPVLGLPQTSMAAITLSSALHTYHKREDAPTPVHLRHTLPPPVDFSAHVKPPEKMGPNQVMVQVYAVAVDWIDVGEIDRKEKEDVGQWIPGRSFVGRCLGVGVEEKEFFRGDLIIGLTSVRKSGALCEFMVVDRRHCARVNPQTSLSVTELAALPSQGIAAHRVLREAMVSRGMQALIMDAHEGIPALMCQELTRKGIAVTAVVSGGDGHAEAQAACMRFGARGVLTGSPVSVLKSLDEGIFHLVVDTHGSAGIYEAARRSLVDGGRLVSLVNPKPAQAAIPQSRSLRGFKMFHSRQKEAKRVVYEYVHPAGAGEPEVDSSGLDYRDILEEPILGVLHPPVNAVVPFERGAEVFRSKRMMDRTNIAVVRLVN